MNPMAGPMHRLAQIRDVFLAGLAVIGAVATIMLMLHVVADITLRNLRNTPIPATYEVVTNYYMIALAFVPLAWVEKSGGMVQVEVINGALSPFMMRLSNLLVAVISAVIYGVLAWVTWQTAVRNTGIGSFVVANQMRVPTWPAYWLPPLGFGLAAMAALLNAVGILLPAPRNTGARA
jgi:TRAP-type C4-dicarboxylate transport system permease small subunit